MVGSALVTIVLDSIATNIASRRPLRASSTSRWVIWPACSAAGGCLGQRDDLARSLDVRLLTTICSSGDPSIPDE